MAARSSASLVTRAALSPPTARSVNVPGCAPCSRASRCSGTLVGEVIVVAAPGTKLSPVITPPVLTVTSAVACCHQGFLAERTATLPPFDRYSPFRGVQYEAVVPVCPRGRLPPHGGHRYLAAARLPAGGGQAAQDRLDPRVARVAGVLEQHACLLRDLRRRAAHPLFEDVAHQCRLAAGAAERSRAAGRVPGPGNEYRRAGVALAVGRLALEAGLDERAAARRRQSRAADDVVDGPRGDLEAVDRVRRVIRVVQVERPGDIPALSRLDRL